MKKILILFVVLFSLISVERLHTVEDTEQICELLLKNVDAMASGAEIIIGPFCIQTDRTCFVDYDGFFVMVIKCWEKPVTYQCRSRVVVRR